MNYLNYGPGMMGNYGWASGLFVFMPLIIIWTIFWKALGLWHSAKREQPWWFLAQLVFNTMGILEIIYLFGILKLKSDQLIPKFKK